MFESVVKFWDPKQKRANSTHRSVAIQGSDYFSRNHNSKYGTIWVSPIVVVSIACVNVDYEQTNKQTNRRQQVLELT